MSNLLVESSAGKRIDQAAEIPGEIPTRFPGGRAACSQDSSSINIPRMDQFWRMSNRVSALSSILRSPARILGIVLLLMFIAEVGVMFVLPHVMLDFFGETGMAVLDAVLLTLVCAPVLWWVIIGPLRRIAIQEHGRSETIVANASEGIVTFNHQGVILSCNRATTDLLSTDLDELLGKTAGTFLNGLPPVLDALPASFRLTAKRSDGSHFPVEVSVSEYPSESKPLRIAIIRDLTAAEQAEAERVMMARETEALRAQQMTTLAQLATGVAHEIRNPLTSIKMLIQVNRSKFADEGFPTDDLQLVEQEIRRMERSVNSLLEFARPEQGVQSVFPIQNVIRKTVQLIEGRCGQQAVKLVIECKDNPIMIAGDASQIQQLLLNLALNALDAMPDGGEVTISVVTIDDQLELSVVDNGEGISDDMLAKLFTPFSTTKASGVGLGLGICRRIADAHGGTLTGQNRASGGAVFCLTLPLVDPSAIGTDDIPVREASCKPY
ncbi:sensor histidine kinase [Aureliella helgolandensis]|uniref:histidine kinase n=1 Tax=Aureliella helgolandensis TaxID=2527968 RepID=A0A518G3T8_9BACT|nr:ATP-binding protein [Aureliella helgolandensis]QDV23230.1 Sporulation kinase D [Aureliella helgolandensis]